jgi:transposase
VPWLQAHRSVWRVYALPAHLPRYEIVIEVESKQCPCCGGMLHLIGEDRIAPRCSTWFPPNCE